MKLRTFSGFLAVLAFFAMTTIFPGCGGPSGGPVPGTLRLAIPAEPTTLDPALVVDVPGGALAARLYEGLVRFDRSDARILPALADTWSVSLDGLAYTFHLRTARFSDGSGPVTASDVVRSFRRVLDPATHSQRTWVLEPLLGAAAFMAGKTTEIEGLAAVDTATVRLVLARRFAPFLGLLAMPAAAVVKTEGVAAGDPPLGTGPFRLAEWSRGRLFRFEANPAWTGDGRLLRAIEVRVIQDELSARAEFESGNLDVWNPTGGNAAWALRHAEFMSTHRLVTRPKLNVYYLAFNCTLPPFDRADVRRALAAALAPAEITETLLAGTAVAAAGPIPPPLPGFLEAPTAPAPTEEVKKRLAALGFADGALRFEIHHRASPEASNVVQILAGQLSRVGVQATPRAMDWNGLKARIHAREIGCAYLNWTADYPDGHNFLFPLFHSKNQGAGGNRAFFGAPGVDVAIEASEGIADGAARGEAYRAIATDVVAAQPWAFLWHEVEVAVAQIWVEGYDVPVISSADPGLGIKILEAH